MLVLKTGWLRRCRRRKHLSLKAVGDLIGKNRSTIYRWESGKCNISTNALLKLLSLYDADISDVLMLEGDENNACI